MMPAMTGVLLRFPNAPLARLGLFVALVAAVAGVAALVGIAVGDEVAPGGSAAHSPAEGTHDAQAVASGLGIADAGYRTSFAATTLAAGESGRIEFRILDADGASVTDTDVEGGVPMHLIVVRRDLTGYQHLHPTAATDGSWETELTLPAAGVYRAFADFERDGRKVVLGTDLFVAGAFEPAALPPPAPATTADGYDVGLAGDVRAGAEGELAFRISRDGSAPALEPYLGARGHLVALREGDLAYLHVHPLDAGEPGEIRFEATFPSPGSYRLFLQFQHEGRVHTAAFTLAVSE
jgi:hypothetical protein